MMYTFQTISKIIYGQGSVVRLGEETVGMGGKHALVVTDKGLVDKGIHEPVCQSLEKAGVGVTLFADVEVEPSPASIEQAAAIARQNKVDCIVGLGGGSALDSAKATALLACHQGPLEKYFGMNLVPGPCLPSILIPTTAGTGSEITSISVVGDAASNSKKGIVSPHLLAKAVLLDPELTLSLPPYYTAITGLDAFVHAMESFVNLSATPFTDGLNLQAMRMIAANLRKAYANGKNVEARAQMLYASAICGMGFSNTQNGVIHALGMAVPAHYHLPHGLLMGAIAPMGIAFNVIGTPEKYAQVAEILGCAPACGSTLAKARSAVDGFTELMHDLHVTPGLAAHGVSSDDLPGIAQRAAGTERLMGNNPRRGTASELEALLREHF